MQYKDMQEIINKLKEMGYSLKCGVFKKGETS